MSPKVVRNQPMVNLRMMSLGEPLFLLVVIGLQPPHHQVFDD
jgi:hypothetical protein